MGWKSPGNAESIAFQVKSLKDLSITIFLFFFCFRPQKIHNSIVYLGSLPLNSQFYGFETLNAPDTSRILRPNKWHGEVLFFFSLDNSLRKLQSIISRGYKYSYHADVTRTFPSRSFTWAFRRTTVRRVYEDIIWRDNQAMILKKQREKRISTSRLCFLRIHPVKSWLIFLFLFNRCDSHEQVLLYSSGHAGEKCSPRGTSSHRICTETGMKRLN